MTRSILDEIFNGSGWEANALNELQGTLREPKKLGARFFWGAHPRNCKMDWSVRNGRHLHIQWDGEQSRPMNDAEEKRLIVRLRDLGFDFVSQKYFWKVLSPTLPHDGFGQRDRG